MNVDSAMTEPPSAPIPLPVGPDQRMTRPVPVHHGLRHWAGVEGAYDTRIVRDVAVVNSGPSAERSHVPVPPLGMLTLTR